MARSPLISFEERDWSPSSRPLGIEQPPQDPGDIGSARSVSRQTLDPMLLERARRAGADIRTGWWGAGSPPNPHSKTRVASQIGYSSTLRTRWLPVSVK